MSREVLETTSISLTMSDFPCLKIFPRAVSSRATEVEVFIIDGQMLLYAKDLAGNTTYIAQAKGTELKRYQTAKTNKVALEEIKKDLKPIEKTEEIEIEDDDFDEVMELFSMLDTMEEPTKSTEPTGKPETTESGETIEKPDIGLNWGDNETSNNPYEDEEPFNPIEDNREETMDNRETINNQETIENNIEVDRSKEVDLGMDNLSTEQLKSLPKATNGAEETQETEETKPEEIKVSKEGTICAFATSTDFLEILSELKKADISVTEKQIVVTGGNDGIIAKFDKIQSYTDIDEIEEILQIPEWETFPIEKIKSIIPVIETVEDAKFRQFLMMTGGRMYTYSDFIAIETLSGHKGRDYLLTAEILRVLKYSTAKDSKVFIGKLPNDGITLNINGLSVFFAPTGEEKENLFDVPREIATPKPFIGGISKEFINKLKMIKKIYKDQKLVNLSVIGQFILMKTEKIDIMVNVDSTLHTGVKILVDIDKLLLALRIANDNNAKFSLYELKKNAATIIISGEVDVLIDAEEYHKEGDLGYDEI